MQISVPAWQINVPPLQISVPPCVVIQNVKRTALEYAYRILARKTIKMTWANVRPILKIWQIKPCYLDYLSNKVNNDFERLGVCSWISLLSQSQKKNNQSSPAARMQIQNKETTFERADSILQLLLFVTPEKGGTNVYHFLSFHFLSAVVPAFLSKDRLSASRPQKVWPTGLEVSSF